MTDQCDVVAGMRILFYSSYPGFSGSQRMALQLAKAFARLGARVVVGAPDRMEYLDRARAAGLEVVELHAPRPLLQYGGTIIQNFGKMGLAMFALTAYTVQAYRFLRSRRVDLVYAATGRCLLLIAPAARLAGIPVVWHAQGGLTKGASWLHRSMALLATRIVCVSKSVLQDLLQVCGPEIARKASVVYNGIPDIQSVPPKPPRGVPAAVTFIGNLIPEKGPHHLIRAFAHLPQDVRANTDLWLVGPEPDPSYGHYLRTLIDDLGITEQVHFTGYVPDVTPYIDKAAFIVYPSVESETLILANGQMKTVKCKEGFGLSALEAMRAAKPVIASNSYGLAEVVADGETGLLVPPGDEDALESAMLALLTKPEMAARLGESARQRFLSYFTEQYMIDGFRAVFAELIAARDTCEQHRRKGRES